MENVVRVGFDVGSTTIKMVVLDEGNAVLLRLYLRHFTDIKATFLNMIHEAQDVLKGRLLSITFTGSAGIGISERLQLPFVQEMISCAKAIQHIIPDAEIAIELGGEDAKITYFGDSVEQRMNGVCAGGTGSFIDHMASLLHTDAAGLNELAKSYQHIYPIASRCGVFAKTDVQSLMNEGVSREDIAASILQAIVEQTISTLAQGRPVRGKIAFLGGPLSFLSELRRHFIDTLALTAEQVLHPESSPYFMAIGAALTSQGTVFSYEALRERAFVELNRNDLHRESIEPLFSSDMDQRAFQARHNRHRVPRANPATYVGKAFLGIDAGSTTTKVVLVNEHGALLYSSYGSNQGKPLETVAAALRDLYQSISPATVIANAVVTGYGERMIRAAFKVDAGEVETVAHLKAADSILPGVSFVLDIGGQDIKSFFVQNGAIASIMLNEACSAGCGSFIETFAQAIGADVASFAQMGARAQKPVDLGTRCTVFMNSRVKQAQKEGASPEDISAGISISVVKNALFKVIRLRNADELGEKIVVQGGTFYNDAVLRAFEKIIGREVVRPDIAGLMGAYGAAIIAKECIGAARRSSLVSAEQLNNFSVQTTFKRCKLCGNQCMITTKHFQDGEGYHTGNKCELGVNGEKAARYLPNLYEYKYRRVFDYQPLAQEKAARGVIGIPRVLNMYEDYPFWFTLFHSLGYSVVLSDRSSRKLYQRGMASIPSETVCYPAKLSHGHIADLLRRGVKKIFYPCIPFNLADDPDADHCYNCPVVTSYPETIKANTEAFGQGEAILLHPFLPIHKPDKLAWRLQEALAAENIPAAAWEQAVKLAYAELNRYKDDVRRKGEEALRYLRENHGQGIVLAGRPYHIDPEVNHGLPQLIQSYGFAILSEDSISHLHKLARPLRVVDQWVYHSRLYACADFVSRQEELALVQLDSFGCGLDAVTIDQVKEMLEFKRKIYTVIKLDEISNLGAARIRIRSLMAALAERAAKSIPVPQGPYVYRPTLFTKEMRNHTILVPQMAPIHFEFFTATLQKAGYNVVLAPMPDRAAIEEGLKYVNNDICYPAIMVIGQLLKELKSGKLDLHHTSILLHQTGGGCRATNYIALMRKALDNAGLSQIPVLALGGEKAPGFSLTLQILDGLVQGATYGDLLMRLLYRVRPYEKISGSADRLCRKWMDQCRADLLGGRRRDFRNNIKNMVHEFDCLEINEYRVKPKVGIVGEILVKYHPVANNHLIELLEREGAEVVVPDLTDFFLYTLYDAKVEYKLLGGSLSASLKSAFFIKIIQFYRKEMNRALKNSRRFHASTPIEEIAKLAQQHVSLGNITGEGWLLTGEMVKLITTGVENIVCLQPFGCLPNHVTGKGMLRELRTAHPGANIVPIDFDPGSSEVNQLNRIKLMLSVAMEKLREDERGCFSGG